MVEGKLVWGEKGVCVCGHSKEDHPEGPTGRYAKMMKAGCCRICWNVPLAGCPVFRPRTSGKQ